MNSKKPSVVFIVLAVVIIALASGWGVYSLLSKPGSAPEPFDGQRAYQDLSYQLELGPRTPGSPGHDKIKAWLLSELKKNGWSAEIQESELMGHHIENVVARSGDSKIPDNPWIILGAHYDTRLHADQDPDPAKRTQPVPGANDGASGVAVLLELSRVLPQNVRNHVWMVFFDAEDNGSIPGWDWILGSQSFVEHLEGKPEAAVIIDMIGDRDLNIYMEQNSDLTLTAEIWKQAADLGYSEQFIPRPKYRMLDDHTPFLNAGIPAVDLIDFDYPYWHTTADTLDKVSARSLKVVGDTLLAWSTNKIEGELSTNQ